MLYDKPVQNQVAVLNVDDASIILKEHDNQAGITIAFGDKLLAD